MGMSCGGIVLALLSGCFPTPAPQPPRIKEEQRYLVHLVAGSSETVARIAKWYTGSEKNSKEINGVNEAVVKNGLQVGERILVPFNLLKTVSPLPAATKSQKPRKQSGGARRRDGVPVSEPAEQPPIEATSETVAPTQPESVGSPSTDLATQHTEAAPAPQAPETDPTPIVEAPPPPSLGSDGKSVEDLIREEQAELEKLKTELESAENPA